MGIDGWQACTIADIAAQTKNALVGGPFGSNLISADYVSEGVPVIRGQNMGFGRWVEGEFAFVSHQKAQSLSANLARPGDLVFTQRGTLGQIAIVPSGRFDHYLISQSQMKLTVDETKADTLFLYYVFSSPAQQDCIFRNAIQTGVPHTNLGILKSTPFLLPPLNEQRVIAGILGVLDDKIELNRRMNETQEAMARAIFKSWFVDFDPVRAKAEGRRPHGMDAETAALFPNSFEDSPLGKIPRGWQTGTLADVCTTQYGFTASASDEPVGPKFLRVTDINKRNWIEWDSVPYCVIGHEGRAKYVLSLGDIVVARMADPGKSAIIEDQVDAVFASYLVRLRNESLAHSYYVHGFLKSQAYTEYSEGAKGGSVQANMNAKVIVGAQLVIPPVLILEAFLGCVLPLRQKLVLNIRQSSSLAAVRDALLPRLISGELRVKDAEKIVGAKV
jgi:type I restriction enzyme S subunit